MLAVELEDAQPAADIKTAARESEKKGATVGRSHG
jgi:hypothetical protein